MELVLLKLPLADLIAQREDMQDVLDSGRISDTPSTPIYVRVREDMPGKYEIADGHHRVAEALRNGATHIAARVDEIPDDEPLEEPFYDFVA